jgi:hypothetical protein
VRVVLDTSKSMCGAACGWQDPPTDPGRLALLSTLLLHDLLKPDPTKADNPDSFAVIPFDREKWVGSDPPQSRSTPVRARGMTGREAFARQLDSIPFDAMNTYYSPGIAQALEDLPPLSSRDSEAITRTIVLITDGKSVEPDADRAYIEQQLLPALAAKQTRLYAIMFGPDAKIAGAAFFDAIARTDELNVQTGRYGQRAFPGYFVVERGDELPATMVKLFSDSFGYLHFPDDRRESVGSGTLGLDLHRNADPSEAAIVALTLDPTGANPAGPPPPGLTLSPPPGKQAMQQRLLKGQEKGGSYALRWESSPAPGTYSLRVDSPVTTSVFVLRPTNLTVDLREHAERGGAQAGGVPSCFGASSLLTMADTLCRMDFLVGSAAGSRGIPPKLSVRYWIRQPKPGGAGFWSINDADGAAIPDGNDWDDAAAQGRRYWTQTLFTKNQIPDAQTEPYRAEIEVKVNLCERTVAFRGADRPFVAEVYPRLAVVSQPASLVLRDRTSGALGRLQTGCARFVLEEEKGTFLESAKGSPGFNVRAFLDAPAPVAEGPLKDARFRLDGESIGFSSGQPAQNEDWSKGRQRSLSELVRRNGAGGEHELCVTLGPYADGDPANPPSLRVRFVLDHPPYDRFDAIAGPDVKVLVAPAPPLTWKSWLPFALLGGALLLALLLLRGRLALPRDLGFALASASAPDRFEYRALPAPHPLRLLLSHRPERRIEGARGELLGWLRPLDEPLYGVRLVRGASLAQADGTPVEPGRRGLYQVEVRRPYRLTLGDSTLWLRLQFA